LAGIEANQLEHHREKRGRRPVALFSFSARARLAPQKAWLVPRQLLLDGDAASTPMISRISQNGVHTTFQFIFAANPLKTSSPPFSWPGIPGRQAHNVCMKISVRTARPTHPFSSAFIRGGLLLSAALEKNKKIKISKRSEPNLGKIPSPRAAFEFLKKSNINGRTQQIPDNKPTCHTQEH